MIIEVPLAEMPDELEFKVGDELELSDEDDNPMLAIVSRLNEDSVVLDGNPPLAGETLIFDLELLAIGSSFYVRHTSSCFVYAGLPSTHHRSFSGINIAKMLTDSKSEEWRETIIQKVTAFGPQQSIELFFFSVIKFFPLITRRGNCFSRRMAGQQR